MNKIDLRQLGIIQNWPDDMSDTEVEECVNHFLTTTPGAIDPGVGKPLSLYDAERLISFEYKKISITKLHLLQSLRDKKMVKNRSHKKARYRINGII
jgi:hypothetical protein